MISKISVPVILFVGLWLLSACSAEPESEIAFSNLPPNGDPAAGQVIYTQDSSPLCSSCHNPDAVAAPTLENYASTAEQAVAGLSAREYTFYAIVEPWRHIAEGYGNAMPNQYDTSLTAQEIADLIAYLLEF